MRASKGFSLIELIIAIVLIGIAVVGISVGLFPQSRQSAELVLASRAAELGHAVMDEVISRKFDHNSGELGGLPVCISEDRALVDDERPCTPLDGLGPDGNESTWSEFNDVDDFDGSRGSVADLLGEEIGAKYPNYFIAIRVFYDADLDGVADEEKGDSKRIAVQITDPQGNHYDFAVYRGNF